MIYIIAIFVIFAGCAAFEKALDTAGTVLPPVADAFFPGTSVIVVGAIGLIGLVSAGVIAYKKKKGEDENKYIKT